MPILQRTAAFVLSLCVCAPALAQNAADPSRSDLAPSGLATSDLATSDLANRSTERLSFRNLKASPRGIYLLPLLGVQSTPEYFGSDSQRIGPRFSPGLVYLNLGWLSLGNAFFADDFGAREDGFGLRGSFRFIGGRKADDYEELRGLDDIDPTLELGLGIGYTTRNLEVYADARYGLGGSDSWVGELGGNYIARPSERFALRVGPRFLYGSEGYTDTYFGVTPAESARSGLGAHDVDDFGLVSAGVEVTATYRLGERWWLEGGARYDRFQGAAADSPIVRQGSADQTEVHIGFRRAFALEF